MELSGTRASDKRAWGSAFLIGFASAVYLFIDRSTLVSDSWIYQLSISKRQRELIRLGKSLTP